LSKLRDGELMLTPEMATALLKTVDAIRQMLERIEQNGNEGERDDGKLIQTLTELQRKEKSEPMRVAEAVVAPPMVVKAPAAEPEVAVPTMGEILVEGGAATADEIAQAMKIQEQWDPRRLGEILVEQGAVRPREIVEALQTQQAASSSASEA
jgi:two-component system, chemotaxis family, sensor kinase CheA